jgi:hypothetical protein
VLGSVVCMMMLHMMRQACEFDVPWQQEHALYLILDKTDHPTSAVVEVYPAQTWI